MEFRQVAKENILPAGPIRAAAEAGQEAKSAKLIKQATTTTDMLALPHLPEYPISHTDSNRL